MSAPPEAAVNALFVVGTDLARRLELSSHCFGPWSPRTRLKLSAKGCIISRTAISAAASAAKKRTVIPLITSSTSTRTRASSSLSSSFDHGVVDGTIAAAYVKCLREYLEHPATLLIE
jgi:hypothetical protein